MRYYSLSAPMMKMLNQNSFLAVDKLDDSLHPELIAYLIQMFLKEIEQARFLLS
jgi:AAA15 family ATPase/GTPase